MSESPPTPGWGPEPAVPSPPRRSAPPGVRISLGGMLWITGAAALIVAALFAFPPVIAAAIASLMSVAFPAMLVGCLLYGSPPWKAFAIGALVPTVMRVVGGIFSGAGGAAGLASSNASLQRMLIQQQFMQQQMRGMRSGANPFGTTTNNTFSYFAQLAEVWDRVGQAYMVEETLFWGGSFIAGLATLLVHRRFARARY